MNEITSLRLRLLRIWARAGCEWGSYRALGFHADDDEQFRKVTGRLKELGAL
jgi:hypothetical protein